ncbi:ATPase P [Aurantiacibacter atlanticus]|uniref:ATPase P n=2 Tax=Aurantiacibacter atlanticus TaxID=1648404 RepID=A0A0H4VFN6_9SPHN|nr:ATPase P [Aurantiacibacter atlanticus]
MEVTDPVCGGRIPLEIVRAHEEFAGWSYFFCSAECAKCFRENPDAYVGDRPGGPPSVDAGR